MSRSRGSTAGRALVGAASTTVGLAVAAGSLLLSLAGAEWLLATRFPIAGRVYRVDERLIVSMVPESRKLFTRSAANGGESVLVRFDPRGFRVGEAPVDGGGARVAVYGDSFVEAEFSRYENTFCARLESRLEDETQREFEVVNAGVVGYGPDQEILRMEQEFEWLGPDFVVIVLSGNDFGDLIRNRLFRIEGGSALVQRSPELTEEFRKLLAPRGGLRRSHLVRGLGLLARPDRLRILAGALPRRSREDAPPTWMKSYVRDSLTRHSEAFRAFSEDRPLSIVPNFEDWWDADIALTPDAMASRYKTKLMELLLARAARFSRERGFGLLAVVVPSLVEECPSTPWAQGLREWPREDREDVSTAFRRVVDAAGVDAVDLRTAFRMRDPCGLYFRVDDDHWNDEGQSIAADVVARALIGALPR